MTPATQAAEDGCGSSKGREGRKEGVRQVSVILPVHNERENLRPLIAEIMAALLPLARPFEIIAVDDGSFDGSRELLIELSDEEPRLKIACLRRNYGQSAAVDAGFRLAAGEIIVTLDADGQNDPADIPHLIGILESECLDLVSGERVYRQDRLLLRTLPSRIANFIIRRVTGTRIRDLGCALRVYRRAVVDELHLYGEMHRFVAVLAEGMGARSAQVQVRHRPRTSGASKYGLTRTFKVLLDLMTVWFMRGFQTKPIYVFGSIGLVLGIISAAMTGFVVYQKLVNQIFVYLQPLFDVSLIFAVMSVQFFGMGIIAELVVRTYFESRAKPPYVIGLMKGFESQPVETGAFVSPGALQAFVRSREHLPPPVAKSK